MFQPKVNRTRLASALSMAELIFHSAAHAVRANHRFAIMSILSNILRVLIILLFFMVLSQLLGMQRSAVRGDFLLFMLSGVFLYIMHVRTVAEIAGSAGPASSMMLHAPMNPFIVVASGALTALYIQTASLLTILGVYYIAVRHFEILDPVGAYGCFLIAWFFGIAVGLVFLAMKPWAPGLTGVLLTLYRRVNMISSGKMFLANSLQPKMREFFDWNPLFHIIDQARGFVFLNYNPQTTSLSYALYVSLVVLCLGLIAEFYTTRHASLSWEARR